MSVRQHFLIGILIIVNTLLGLRGLWREDRNFFTMHPFSDPIVTCSVTASDSDGPLPLPLLTYRRMPTSTFTNRIYLEVIPLYTKGLTTLLQQSHPKALVTIRCLPLFSHDS